MPTTHQHIFKAAILDMDGVITQTARLHAKAWKKMFDEFLQKQEGDSYIPFDIKHDYKIYIDGKPRLDGIRSFLASRKITLPEGQPDEMDQDSVYALGMRKNAYFLEIIDQEGVEVFPDTLDVVRQWKDSGIKLAVVSSSRNCKHIMESAGILSLFRARVDGVVAEEKKLKGKPAPDIFLEACKMLGVTPSHSVVIEDAIAGVQAGKQGNFAVVVGVARHGEDKALKDEGADIIVHTLTELPEFIKPFDNLFNIT